jgi:hypothetical protein
MGYGYVTLTPGPSITLTAIVPEDDFNPPTSTLPPVGPANSTFTPVPTDIPTPIPTLTSTSTPVPTLIPTNTPDLVPPPTPQLLNPPAGAKIECQIDETEKAVRLEWIAVEELLGTTYTSFVPYGSPPPLEEGNTFAVVRFPCGSSSIEWFVIAKDSAGHESESLKQTFSLVFPDTTGPASPPLLEPKNGAGFMCNLNQSVNVTLKWGQAGDPSGIKGYEVWLMHWEQNEWKRIGERQFVTGNQFNVPVPCGHDYAWTVRAIDNVGNQSEWSGTTTFSAKPDEQGPPPPRLTQPTNRSALDCSGWPSGRRPVDIAWEAVEDPSGISSYQITLILWKSKSDTVTIIDNQPTNRTRYTTPYLLCGQRYVWSVRAVDGRNNLGRWAESYYFDLKSP